MALLVVAFAEEELHEVAAAVAACSGLAGSPTSERVVSLRPAGRPADALALFAYAGLRRRELLGFDWGDVDD